MVGVGVVRMETVAEGGDGREDGGHGDEDDDGHDSRRPSSLSMCKASERRTLTTSFPPRAHRKVVLCALAS